MILIDTHTLIWALDNNSKLSVVSRTLLDTEKEVFVSAASAWEIATKFRAGRLPEVALLMQDFVGTLRRDGFLVLSVTAEHFLLAGSFSMSHKDPFDRLIAAQAKLENMPLLSADPALDQFPIQRIW